MLIPDAVYAELTTGDGAQPGGTEVQTFPWIVTKTVTNQAIVTALQMELDPGEAAAIALAVELKADLLLLDERRGRAVATRFGRRFVGLLGVIIEAQQRGYLTAVKLILEDLVTKAGFWVSPQLYIRVLDAAGE